MDFSQSLKWAPEAKENFFYICSFLSVFAWLLLENGLSCLMDRRGFGE